MLGVALCNPFLYTDCVGWGDRDGKERPHVATILSPNSECSSEKGKSLGQVVMSKVSPIF